VEYIGETKYDGLNLAIETRFADFWGARLSYALGKGTGNANGTPPAYWTEIRTHPGVVNGAWNVRRIRETGRVLSRSFPGQADPVELLEVRFDADFDIEGVVQGQGSTGLVTGRDQHRRRKAGDDVGWIHGRHARYLNAERRGASIG